MGNKPSAGNDQPYAAPAPDTFYIHDDLSDWVHQAQGEDSEAYRLTKVDPISWTMKGRC